MLVRVSACLSVRLCTKEYHCHTLQCTKLLYIAGLHYVRASEATWRHRESASEQSTDKTHVVGCLSMLLIRLPSWLFLYCSLTHSSLLLLLYGVSPLLLLLLLLCFDQNAALLAHFPIYWRFNTVRFSTADALIATQSATISFSLSQACVSPLASSLLLVCRCLSCRLSHYYHHQHSQPASLQWRQNVTSSRNIAGC